MASSGQQGNVACSPHKLISRGPAVGVGPEKDQQRSTGILHPLLPSHLLGALGSTGHACDPGLGGDGMSENLGPPFPWSPRGRVGRGHSYQACPNLSQERAEQTWVAQWLRTKAARSTHAWRVSHSRGPRPQPGQVVDTQEEEEILNVLTTEEHSTYMNHVEL